jgi:enediyne biosynthesis protein E4
MSSSELVLTFGLAGHTQADAVEIHWPSGQVDTLKSVGADEIVTVKEGTGSISANPLAKR